MTYFSFRRGTTLIELLIFITILAIAATAIIPLLFAATEDRLLQQTVSLVEQNGSQILQTIGTRIRNAERILDPSLQSTGSVLALQTGSGAENPVIIGVYSGALIMARKTLSETLSTPQVAVEDFVVRNTSVSASRQSVQISFRISRAIRLQLPRSYSRVFQGMFSLFPADQPQGDGCQCANPSCGGSNYIWEVCSAGTCMQTQMPLECR